MLTLLNNINPWQSPHLLIDRMTVIIWPVLRRPFG